MEMMGMVRLLVLQNCIVQVLPDIRGRKECVSLFQNFGGLKDGCRQLRNSLKFLIYWSAPATYHLAIISISSKLFVLFLHVNISYLLLVVPKPYCSLGKALTIKITTGSSVCWAHSWNSVVGLLWNFPAIWVMYMLHKLFDFLQGSASGPLCPQW